MGLFEDRAEAGSPIQPPHSKANPSSTAVRFEAEPMVKSEWEAAPKAAKSSGRGAGRGHGRGRWKVGAFSGASSVVLEGIVVAKEGDLVEGNPPPEQTMASDEDAAPNGRATTTGRLPLKRSFSTANLDKVAGLADDSFGASETTSLDPFAHHEQLGTASSSSSSSSGKILNACFAKRKLGAAEAGFQPEPVS